MISDLLESDPWSSAASFDTIQSCQVCNSAAYNTLYVGIPMRHDHTSWLVHFVRDRNPQQDFPGEDEDDAGAYAGGELEWNATAFSVLKTIVRLGGLIPGHSFRNGRTTIYGGHPVVCATEMPLYSFADYARQRSDPSKVSAYGIAFLKSDFFAAGGRPAIYGLSTEAVSYVSNTSTRRVFADTVLPIAEQYRFVAYNPTSTNWIDWSHEREWRWMARGDDKDQVWAEDYSGVLGPVPALPLMKGCLDGRSFSKLCFIVWTSEEASELQELLTGFYLAGGNNYDTEFDRLLISRSRIIVLADVVAAVEDGKKLRAQTIEGLEEANLLRPIVIHELSEETKKQIELALDCAGDAGHSAALEYAAKHPTDTGSSGFAHAITFDVTDPIVQQLLSSGRASGPFDGKVIISIPGKWPFRHSIDYQEHIMTAAVASLKKSLGLSVFVDTRLD
jgi:hypothetical protein